MDDEVKIVVSVLKNVSTQSNVSELRSVLQRLIVLMNRSKDLSEVLYYVAKILPTHDLVVKRLSCVLIARYIRKAPDVCFLVCNTLLQDCSDPNPLVRTLVLKTVFCCFSVAEDIDKFLDKGLNDPSPLVRRTAVLGCARLHERFPNIILDRGYVDRLYNMLRDVDPIVICNCVAVLEQILTSEGGMVINRSIAMHLLGHSTQMTEWGLLEVLKVLARYEPKSKDEKFEIMNVLDPFLHSQNSAVVIHIVRLFLKLLVGEAHLRSQIFVRATPHIAVFLNTSHCEVVYLILQFIHEHLDSFRDQFSVISKGLFCKHYDSVHIKVLKIEILTLLSLEQSSKSVLDELFALCTDSCTAVSKAAIDAIGKMSLLHQKTSISCMRKLLLLLTIEDENTTVHVLNVLQRFDIRSLRDNDHFVASMRDVSRSVTTVEGKLALLWFLGEHGHILPNGPYILEDIANEFCNTSENFHVKETILICLLKMFFLRPAEIQPILGRFAEQCFIDCNGADSLGDQVQFYLKLMKYDLNVAKEIILGDK